MASTHSRIKEILRHQKYHQYVVTDIGTFPWCLPGYNQKGTTSEEKVKNLTPQAKEAYDRYQTWRNQSGPPVQPLFFMKGFTGETFINAAKKIKNQAECSNFAHHAIGTLLQYPEITKEYNVCLAGIMGGRHNIALLLPKNYTVAIHDLQNGIWPVGTLVVDPWAVGMGHHPDKALGVPLEQFVFNYPEIMSSVVIHYQSALDDSLKNDSELIDIKKQFAGLATASTEKQTLLDKSGFTDHLDRIKEKALYLHQKGYVSAFNTAVDFYNQLVEQRNKFVNTPLSEDSKNSFAKESGEIIAQAKVSELGHFRGFSKLFFGILNVCVR